MRLIDADAFRKGMHHEAFETDSDLQKWDSGCWIRWKMLENHLQKTPTVDAAPVVHGKWEYIPGDGKFRAILICSRCRRNVGEYNRFNYCPHCGAKMDL